jgi:serine protease Do
MSYNYPNNQPWDDRVYETGRTRPRKSRGGVIAVLLILVVFLGGLTCVLGLLNFRLFRQLNAQERKQENTHITFSNIDELPTDHLGTASLDSQNEVLPQKEPEKDTLPLTQIPTEPGGATLSGKLTWQEVYKKNIPSVVSITCSHLSGSSTGTGVIFTADGYIVTNSHVVEGAREISVLLTDDRVFAARLVGADTVSDLAVLHIEAEDLIPAEFGDSAGLQVGDEVVAIGDPLGTNLRGTMTDGIISAINRDMSIDGRSMTLIQTSAALNSGNSGGPLINCYGMVIGINTMKISAFTDEAGVEGLGFAIPSTTVKEIVEQIIENGYVSGRPTLGIHCEVLSSMYQHYYRLPDGLYINEVDRGSPASDAGIAKGDVIVSINGTGITDMETYNAFLYSQQVGDTVILEVYRSGKYYTVRLTFAEDQG